MPYDPIRALDLYALAAYQGLAEAENNLGSMHDGWSGIAAEYNRAFELYMRAANEGHTEALSILANIYCVNGLTYGFSIGVD